MSQTLTRSFAYCERLARRQAGNFQLAFRVLPGDQRRAMCTLYSFLRITDDLSDSEESPIHKRLALEDWRSRLDRALVGHYSHRVHPALHQIVQVYSIPRVYLEEAIVGVTMDLDIDRYATFADLQRYCYRVASVVGLACIHIWGFQKDCAKNYAEQAGLAFQLTNILRDLREDADRGRIYLPTEDLVRFGYDEASLQRGQRDEAFRALMRFEVERARAYYEASRPLSDYLSPSGKAVFSIMSRTYRGLLEAIEARDYDVFSGRVRLSSWKKLGFAVQALPIRMGLVT